MEWNIVKIYDDAYEFWDRSRAMLFNFSKSTCIDFCDFFKERLFVMIGLWDEVYRDIFGIQLEQGIPLRFPQNSHGR